MLNKTGFAVIVSTLLNVPLDKAKAVVVQQIWPTLGLRPGWRLPPGKFAEACILAKAALKPSRKPKSSE